MLYHPLSSLLRHATHTGYDSEYTHVRSEAKEPEYAQNKRFTPPLNFLNIS